MKGYKGEDAHQRSKQTKEKKGRDATRLHKQWPATVDIKAAVKQAMVDLNVVCSQFTGCHSQLAEMNRLITGIIQYNEYAGRIMEWAILDAAHVEQVFSEGGNILVENTQFSCLDIVFQGSMSSMKLLWLFR